MCPVSPSWRRIALCRELTKMNEEVLRVTVAEAVALYETREPRGEYVLVIEGGARKRNIVSAVETMTVEEAVAYYLGEGMSRNEAVKAAAKALGLSRSEVYDRTKNN